MSEPFSSPFSHVLRTNYAASFTETQAIHTLLAAPSEELSRLAGEISRVRKTLEELTSRYDHLKTHVDAHLALISPLRRLPREIISEIFVQCLPTDRNPTRSLTEAPLLLTVLSKGLREIALSTPQLWNALHVFLPNTSFNSPIGIDELEPLIRRRKEGVEAWFQRSRCLPLSISVYLSGYGRISGSVSDSYVAFLQSIISFSRRWKRAELHLSPFFMDMLNGLVADFDSEDIPWLESVEIFYDSSSENGRPAAGVYLPLHSSRKPQLPLRDLINRALSLHSFAVHHHSESLHQLQLPWSNLTNLTMKSARESSRLTVDQTLHILASSPNLSTCTLGVLLTTSNSGLELPYIALNSLRALSLHFTLPSNDLPVPDVEARFHNLFGIIRAPLLSRFAFIARGFEFKRGTNCIPFEPLLKRSGCRLEEIYLSFPLKSQTMLVDCLRTLPAVTHLYLESCMPSQNRFDPDADPNPVQIVDDVLIGHLTIGQEDPTPICPRLENLILPDCRYVSEEALLSFAHSRAISVGDGIARLKLLDVQFSRERSDHLADTNGMVRDARFTPQIEQLRREGILVSWKYPVRETPHIPDSPWEGLPKSPYSGWTPELLSQSISYH